eukprot:UC4_evm1s1425
MKVKGRLLNTNGKDQNQKTTSGLTKRISCGLEALIRITSITNSDQSVCLNSTTVIDLIRKILPHLQANEMEPMPPFCSNAKNMPVCEEEEDLTNRQPDIEDSRDETYRPKTESGNKLIPPFVRLFERLRDDTFNECVLKELESALKITANREKEIPFKDKNSTEARKVFLFDTFTRRYGERIALNQSRTEDMSKRKSNIVATGTSSDSGSILFSPTRLNKSSPRPFRP